MADEKATTITQAALTSRKPIAKAFTDNLDVDYVISFRFNDTDKAKAEANFEKLIHALARVGLEVNVRDGGSGSLLVFTRLSDQDKLRREVYRSRVKDWLHGIRTAEPDRESTDLLTHEPLTPAERLRIVYRLITRSRNEGGADITPGKEPWQNIESIFPLHDHKFNREWLKTWSSKTLLLPQDLDQIRDQFGEKIAFYFAFTQSYFTFLFFPAVFGISCWWLLETFSPIYAVANLIWTVVFVEYWKKQEIDLAYRWGVKGVSEEVEEKRRDFKFEKTMKDPMTGEEQQIFPVTTRLQRQVLQIPFVIVSAIALSSLILFCFGIEIFLNEIYHGPFKSVLVYLPTGLTVVLQPTLLSFLTSLATRLNEYENYETTDAYQSAMVSKIFVLNFITSYLPILITAFLYVPFGAIFVPMLDVFSLTAQPFAESSDQMKISPSSYAINPNRLQTQVIYFTTTAQVVNFGLETILPYVQRKVFKKVHEVKAERAAKRSGTTANVKHDAPEEKAFLDRVRDEAELTDYDVTTDLREMVVQYGYLSLFSVVWPLVPLSFFINNWVELRGDAAKIAIETRRPTPYRAESIGPWLDSLSFLTWTGSITSSALVYLFSNGGLGPDGTPFTIKGWVLLLVIFFSEHIYLGLRYVVASAIAKIDSPGLQKARGERFMVRKRYLEEYLGADAAALADDLPAPTSSIPLSRVAIEEDMRKAAESGSYGEQSAFWNRQRGWEETLAVGKKLLESMAESKKKQ